MMSSSTVERGIVRLLTALIAALLFAGAPARADIFEMAAFTFTAGEEAGTYELAAQLPESALGAGAAAVTWPTGCAELASDRQVKGGVARLSYEIQCDRDFNPRDTIVTPWEVDGATLLSTVTGFQVQRNLSMGPEGMVLPIGDSTIVARPLGKIAGDYTWQGVLHILMGWDHLAFVLCLCLLARGRELLVLITTFTAGHSVSLALAFFEVVHVPVPPVEAVIALSITCMAREALRMRGEPYGPEARRRYMVVVGAFGLLHGLGFASVLGDLGVVEAERVSGLIFFNVGVEIGQLLFVGAVMAAMGLARVFDAATPVRQAALYGAGALGCFWMFERVASFGGAVA